MPRPSRSATINDFVALQDNLENNFEKTIRKAIDKFQEQVKIKLGLDKKVICYCGECGKILFGKANLAYLPLAIEKYKCPHCKKILNVPTDFAVKNYNN